MSSEWTKWPRYSTWPLNYVNCDSTNTKNHLSPQHSSQYDIDTQTFGDLTLNSTNSNSINKYGLLKCTNKKLCQTVTDQRWPKMAQFRTGYKYGFSLQFWTVIWNNIYESYYCC